MCYHILASILVFLTLAPTIAFAVAVSARDKSGPGCSYISGQTRYIDSISWSLRVHTGKNCGGEHWEGFRGHLATNLDQCGGCMTFASTLNQKIAGLVFSTPGSGWDFYYEQPTVLGINLYRDDNCQDFKWRNKGKAMGNMNVAGQKMGSFKVCYDTML
ncbi:hypothetical protein BJ138DRAFT_1157476 [Hygrophoropsis aurantiaca]|uniref:Uncharacterized protein n=1 Tax=Hygrophoropsis aurantiaca TaxID=72124 RepID=A0ACB8A762_9AGAM|nr:hypothetical protein BJ138DRAFT_1157476 [Hygrophoropsis aurantiaca]